MSRSWLRSGMLLVLTTMVINPAPILLENCAAQEAVAESATAFRVETDIYFGDQKEPAQQSLTIFSGGVAYDISFDDPNQITLVDVSRGRIVLLNKQSRTQTSIDLKELQQYMQTARQQAASSPLAAFLRGADAIEEQAGKVLVGDQVLRYEASLQQPRDTQMAAQYAEVADALCLLNGWRSGVPPFARLSLNRVVAERQTLPEEITRTTSSNNQSEVVRCRLHANWRLSKDDEQQVAEIGTMLVSFKSISTPEFFAAVDKQTVKR